ncbi:MAG: Gfo/Idh/MocA family oxidoreductase [Lentisphaerae bacterium]|nr:Gfo/Idh/MocA family oxidoreductase [Lentisphaerota bacterium]
MSNAVKPVDVVLVGVGGYGHVYADAMLAGGEAHGARLVAVVDPFAEDASCIAEVRARGIPVYEHMDGCFARHAVALAVISSPIHLHSAQIQRALAGGAHVLCEKPASGSLDEGLQALAASRAANRFVAIGYQWSFSEAIQRLKRDLMAGRFGLPKRFRTLVLWPRMTSYYERNAWAGRQLSDDGRPVFDSPANNACAHYLHNMFYLLGPTREQSARPASVEAELYRAKPIENFDTAAIRCLTTTGAEVLFYTSHAVEATHGPLFTLECEAAVITGGGLEGEGCIEARCADGEVIAYGLPDHSSTKLWESVDAVRSGAPVACPLLAALSQTAVITAASQSPSAIVEFPKVMLETVEPKGQPGIVARGLSKALVACHAQGLLPSQDTALTWARPAEVVDTSAWLPAI